MPYFQKVSNGPRLYYEVHGDSAPRHRIVFTMGLGGTSNQWQPQVEYFSSLPGFQVLVHDNRGIGFSDPVPGRWTTTAMAQDILQLLDHLDWKTGVHAVGLSMGGMITQELVLLDVPRFSSMALISTIAGGLSSLQLFLTRAHLGIWKVFRTFTAKDPRVALRNGMELLYPREFLEGNTCDQQTGQPVSNMKIYRAALIRRGKENYEAGMPVRSIVHLAKQATAVVTHCTGADRLAQLDRCLGDSTSVITGDSDILVHPKNSEILCRGMPSACLVTLTCAGHGCNESAAARVNEELRANIERGAARNAKQIPSRL